MIVCKDHLADQNYLSTNPQDFSSVLGDVLSFWCRNSLSSSPSSANPEKTPQPRNNNARYGFSNQANRLCTLI